MGPLRPAAPERRYRPYISYVQLIAELHGLKCARARNSTSGYPVGKLPYDSAVLELACWRAEFS